MSENKTSTPRSFKETLSMFSKRSRQTNPGFIQTRTLTNIELKLKYFGSVISIARGAVSKQAFTNIISYEFC